jgi:benzoyl-CoA reductase subunit C
LSKKITDEDIDRGINVMNKNRSLMRTLSETRKASTPPITGEDAMFIGLADQVIEKEEHSGALEKLIASFNGTQARDVGVRLMLVGSEDDDTEFVKMVESVGATFVVDDHCTGTRYFWNQVEPSEDRLGAIAARYVNRPACPSKDWPERTRIPHIVSLAKEYGAQGAIVIQQKFCDPHELDIPAIQKALKDVGIPTLFLEFDVTVPFGQFRVRVEAFLEMISDEDLF